MSEGKTASVDITDRVASLSIGKEEEGSGGSGEVEVLADAAPGSTDDKKFDAIVGAIETIMMSDKFQNTQDEFCRSRCDVFEDSDENKLEYTTVFREYTDLIETLLMKELRKAVEGFSVEGFMRMLAERKEQVAGDIFDMLTSFGDFHEFKGLMLSYKAQAAFEAGGDSGAAGSLMVFAPTVIAVKPAVSKA